MITDEIKSKILSAGEAESYFMIDECGGFIFHMNHEMAHGRIPEESHVGVQQDIDEVRELQQFAVDNLTRFGIDPESAKDRENGDYWKWFRFYDNWKKELSEEDWYKVQYTLNANLSLDEYLPKTKWNNV